MYNFVLLLYNFALAKFNQIFISNETNRWHFLIFIIPFAILITFLTKIYDLLLIENQVLQPLSLLAYIFIILFVLLFFISLFFKRTNKDLLLESLPIKKEILDLIYYSKLYFFYLLIELILIVPYLIIVNSIISYSLKFIVGFVFLLVFIPILAYSFFKIFVRLHKFLSKKTNRFFGRSIFILLCGLVGALIIFNYASIVDYTLDSILLILNGNIWALILLFLLIVGCLRLIWRSESLNNYGSVIVKREKSQLYFLKKSITFSFCHNEIEKYRRHKSLLIDNLLFFGVVMVIFIFLSLKKEVLFQFVIDYNDIFPYLVGTIVIFPYINYGSLIIDNGYVPYYRVLPMSLNKFLVCKLINSFIFAGLSLIIFAILMILVYDYNVFNLCLFLFISLLEVIVINMISMIFDLLLKKGNFSQKASININVSKLLTILSLIVMLICKIFVFITTNSVVFEYILILFLGLSIFVLKVIVNNLFYSNN